FFFFQAEDGIRDFHVTGVQTCALPISSPPCSVTACDGVTGAQAVTLQGGDGAVYLAVQLGVVELLSILDDRRMLGPVLRMQRQQIGRASCRERVQSAGGAVGVRVKMPQ